MDCFTNNNTCIIIIMLILIIFHYHLHRLYVLVFHKIKNVMLTKIFVVHVLTSESRQTKLMILKIKNLFLHVVIATLNCMNIT